MKILRSISGGGAFARGMAVAEETISLTYEHHADIYVGTSSGALIGAMCAILGVEEGCKAVKSYTARDAFYIAPPMTEKGKMHWYAWTRLLRGCISLGWQQEYKLIKKHISLARWFAWINDDDKPDCYVTTVAAETGKRYIWNLKTDPDDYEEFVKILSASTRIPGMTQPEYIRDRDCPEGTLIAHYDGGMRDHNPGAEVLKYLKEQNPALNITDYQSIYARPKDWQWNNPQWGKGGIVGPLQRTIEVFTVEVSKGDEEKEIVICEKYGIERRTVYLNRILPNFYSSNEQLLMELERDSVKEVHNTFDNANNRRF